MHLSAHLDVDLVAVEQPDELTVLLELVAPAPPAAAPRPPATVEVVLDRSGSMAGAPLQAAIAALVRLVDRLDPGDRLGVVAFDDAVQVVLPCGPLTDRAAAKAAVRAIAPGGMTNLSGGLLRGLQEARRAAGPAGATVVLVSDGHANDGVTDPARLGAVTAGAAAHGVTTATVGLGLGYDERLLAEVARGGRGDHAFAESAEEAAVQLAGQVEGLLSKTVQAASLTVRPTGDVASVRVHNDLPGQVVGDGLVLELGDLWAGEARKLVLTLGVPAMAALGLAQVAELQLRAVVLPDLVEEVLTLPLSVNVVPGDQAAGRVADPRVTHERLFLEAQEAKRRAADLLDQGDLGAATRHFAAAAESLACAPPSAELDEERAVLEELARRAAQEGAWAAKRSRAEHHRKARKRGR